MGWYKWYVGKAISGDLPERFEAMEEESNQINLIINESASNIVLSDELLKEFKEYILNLIKKEDILFHSLNIKIPRMSKDFSIDKIEQIEKDKGIKLTKRIKEVTKEGTSKAHLIDYLTSKSFLDKIAKRGAIMSFTVLGGSSSYEQSNSKQRSEGKTKTEKILKRVLSKRNKNGAKELLDFLMKQDDSIKSEAEYECIQLLLNAIDEEIKNSYPTLMVQKGKRLTTSEQKIKTWFKQLGKKLSQKAREKLGENNTEISESMQNLIKGNLIPVNSTFALQLNDYINDTRGMYQDKIHLVFYTEDETKRNKVSVLRLAQGLYELIIESLGSGEKDNSLRNWLLQSENKKNIVQIFSAAWSGRDLSQDFNVYNKSNISNVCGIAATTLMFSNISDNLNVKLNDAYNQLSQLSASDMYLSLFEKDYGIQIKNYTSQGKTITLYDDTSFNLMDDTARRYISENLLRCIRFLLINSPFLSNYMNIDVDRDAIKKILLLEMSTFLRIDDYKAESTFNKNSFFVINGQVLSSAYVLCQAYKQAERALRKGKEYHLFNITKRMGKIDYIEEDDEIKGAMPLPYDPFMFEEWGTSIKVEDIWYPIIIKEANSKNLACNINLEFKGIKIKL